MNRPRLIGRRVGPPVAIIAALAGVLWPAVAGPNTAALSQTAGQKDTKTMPIRLPVRITVQAGESVRIDTPVSVDLPQSVLRGAVRLEEIKGDNRLPVSAQIESGRRPGLWWILAGTTPAGTKRVYELTKRRAAGVSGVKVSLNDKTLDVFCGKAKVLRYHHAVMPAPKGTSKNYARSGFIHPLWAPDGQVLTAVHPKDHIHHMGIWDPWTSTEFEGRKVDFWNLKAGTGTVRFVKFASKTSGPVFGGFRAVQEHVDLSAPKGAKVALNENLDVRIWNLGGTEKGFLVDYVTTQRCASRSPLLLKKYRYGGFGFRATQDWHTSNSHVLTSEGKTRKDGHATRAKWCIVYGTTAKGPAGIVFMSHPGNRSHPEPMRIWPPGTNNDRSNMFFNFCPVQQAPWTLKPGRDYVRRYRFHVYAGKVTPKEAERLWQDYANPPRISTAKAPAAK